MNNDPDWVDLENRAIFYMTSAELKRYAEAQSL
jgi:hypothetical protein